MNDKDKINQGKITKIKEIFSQSVSEIEKIKDNRDKKINDLIKEIDNKKAEEILKDLKC
jgi:vacuolar-type H+-ATPase subunit E/Vma4